MGKKKHRKMPAWRRYARMGVGLVGAGVGAVVALSPTFRGIKHMFTDPAAGAADVVFDTTGVTIGASELKPDVGRILGTAVVVAAGIGLIMLFRQVARRI